MKAAPPGPEPGPLEPLFIDGPAGRLFALYFAPAARSRPRRPAVLYLPPFAEEMNRARRMATLLGRMLAESGVGCLLLDPYGTGDSAGDFADARWDLWRDDAAEAARWLAARGHGDIAVLGLRLGAPLALELAAMDGSAVTKAVVWSPVLSGELFLNQFLRIRTAAGLAGGLAGAGGGETTKSLRARLHDGETLEIGGYALTPGLAEAISALDLVPLGAACPAPIDWLEICGGGDGAPPALPPAGARAAERLRAAGADLSVTCIAGERFWAIEETVVIPELLNATLALWGP